MDFVKWSARYGKHKFYKFLLFFIIFCLVTFFVKSCKVHAATLDGTIKTTYVTKYCSEKNGNIFCVNGNNFVYTSPIVSTSERQTSFANLQMLNNAVLFTQYIREYQFSSPITISGNSIKIDFYNEYSSRGSGTSCEFRFKNQFPRSQDSENNIYQQYWNNNNIIPYFAEYYDSSTNEWVPTDIGIYQDSSPCVLYFTFYNIPDGTIVPAIRYYLGLDSSYSGLSTTLNNDTVPVSSNWNYYQNGSSTTTITHQYSLFSDMINSEPNFNTYYLPKGSIVRPNRLITLTRTDNSNHHIVTTRSDRYQGQYQRTFTNMNLSDMQEIQNQIDSINQQETIIGSAVSNVLNGSDTNYSGSWFSNALSGFTNSNESNSFLNLFNSLFTYPLSKFSVQLNTDLTVTNINGNKVIASDICWGTDMIGNTNNPISLSWHGASFNLPCVHKDIYYNLTSEDFAFYPETFQGADMGNHGNSHNLYNIIRIILDGFLIYCLFITCLDIYKYVLDSDRKEIEVLDL